MASVRTLHVVGVTVALAASLWAARVANGSGSWDAGCYEKNNCDALTFTVAAELLEDGRTPYLEAARREHLSRTRLAGAAPRFDLPFQYPPHALPLFALRSLAAPRIASVVTAFVTTLLFLSIFWHLVSRTVPERLGAFTLMLGVSLAPTVAFNAALSQTGLLAAALAVAASLCWQRSPAATGVFLGLLSFKPQYAAPLLAVAAARGDWRVLLAAVVTFSMTTVLSGLLFGFDEWLFFAHAAGQPNPTLPWMVNWMGGAWRAAPQAADRIQAAALPVFAIGTIALGMSVRRIRAWTSLDGQLATVLAWAVVFSPNTHPYDLLVLAPALVYVAGRLGGARVAVAFLAMTLWTLPQPSRWIMVLATVALAAACSHLLRREAQRGQLSALSFLFWPDGQLHRR